MLQAARWHHLEDLQEQHDELIQDIILHRRVFKESLLPPRPEGERAAAPGTTEAPAAASSTKSHDRAESCRVKGSAFAQSMPFYSHTSTATESLSIGVFDEAASLLNTMSQMSPRT